MVTKNEKKNEFSILVSRIVSELKLSLGGAAKLIGTSRRTIGRIINAEVLPRTIRIDRLNFILKNHEDGYKYNFEKGEWYK